MVAKLPGIRQFRIELAAVSDPDLLPRAPLADVGTDLELRF